MHPKASLIIRLVFSPNTASIRYKNSLLYGNRSLSRVQSPSVHEADGVLVYGAHGLIILVRKSGGEDFPPATYATHPTNATVTYAPSTVSSADSCAATIH